MTNNFSLKTIRATVTLGKGMFSDGGNVKVIEGLACEAAIEKPGLPQRNSATLKVWGLKLENMEQLSMLAYRPLEAHHNLLRIEAGEQGGGLAPVFQGEITSAAADFNSAPDVCMELVALSGSYPQRIAEPPLTVRGEAPVDSLFARFAAEAGYAYRNEGVSGSVRDSHYPGSPIRKMEKLAGDIGCELFIDDGLVLTLPSGKARGGAAVFLSKNTGLLGYPTFTQEGISCRCLFNPALAHGGLIKVESIVPRASGTWKISRLTHNIAAYLPSGGSWESRIDAILPE